VEEYLVILQEPLGKEQTVGILRGESANLRESLDLVEVQGRYCKYSQEVEAQEEQSRRSEPRGSLDLHVYRASGFRGLKLQNIATEIAIL
jgi:hypothetical protein